MSANRIARGYARALIALCRSRQTLEAIKKDVTQLSALCDNREFILFLRSPVIPQQRKIAVARSIFGGRLHEVLLSLVVLLMRRRRESFLPRLLAAFMSLYYDRIGVTKATATFSFQPKEALLRRFRALVKRETGKDVLLEVVVDPAIVGGYMLSIGHRRADHRVVAHLSRIRDHLS